MPGPSSAATTSTPRFPSWLPISRRTISPRTAYRTMFRASSEIAVATTASSVEGKPHCAANSRPFCRADTMSASVSMDTRTSSAMSAPFMLLDFPLGAAMEVLEPFLQVQRRRHTLQREPQLDHRERDLGLDADDDGLRAAQPDHVGDVAERAGRERIDHVERGDVHDDAARADLTDLIDQRVAQLLQVVVRERGLDRRDQIRPLLEDRDLHRKSFPTRARSPARASA